LATSTSVAYGECLLAEAEGEVIGFIMLSCTFFGFGFIPLIVVAASQRRRGVGLRLLAEAQLRCSSPKLFGAANVSNSAAQALFARAGFTRSRVIENLDTDGPEIILFRPGEVA